MRDQGKTKAQLIDELQQVRTKNAELQSILETTDDLVFILDQNNYFTSVFAAEGKLYLPPADFVGKMHREVMPPKVNALYEQALHKVKKGFSVGYEYELSMDGETKWYSTKLTPKYDGNTYLGIIAISREISKQKLSEKSVLEAGQRAQNYLDLAGVIVVALNTQGHITLINKKGCETLGLEQPEILGMDWFDHFIPPEIVAGIRTVFQSLMTGDLEPVEYYDNPVITNTSEERIIAWHNSVLKN